MSHGFRHCRKGGFWWWMHHSVGGVFCVWDSV